MPPLICRSCLVVVLLLLLPVPTQAGDPPPSEPGAQPLDFLTWVTGLHAELERHRRPPEVDGPGGELQAAWKASMKRRAPRMASRLKDLKRSGFWEFDAEGRAAVRLAPDQWGPAVRRLASLYTELGTAAKGYDAIRVSPDRALALWDRRNPPPSITGLTPAGQRLQGVRAQIAGYRRLQKPVPGWLLVEHERLVQLEQLEIAARLEARRYWEAERVRAHAAIRERAAQTVAIVTAHQALLAGQLESVRSLTAALQEVEEQRLGLLVGAFDPTDPVHEETREVLGVMAQGRQEAQRFGDPRTSRWGDRLRRKWMVPREKVLRALDQARKRVAAGGASAAPEEAGSDR